MSVIAKVESEGAIAAWRIAMAIMTLIMSALLSLILTGINKTNNIAEAARDNNNRQDQSIALLQAQTQSLQRVSDATVASLQSITLTITRNGDRLENLDLDRKAGKYHAK